VGHAGPNEVIALAEKLAEKVESCSATAMAGAGEDKGIGNESHAVFRTERADITRCFVGKLR